MDDSFRLAEVLGALSQATDLAAGQMPESAVGATILAVRIARSMGLSDDELVDTYYACITRFIGCTSTAMEVSPLALGDDISLNYALNMSDPADPDSVRTMLENHFALDASADKRAETIEKILQLLPQLPYAAIAHCEQALALADRLPMPHSVEAILAQMESRWDGLNPTKAKGTDVPQIARIIEFAIIAELYRRAGGPTAVLDIARRRSGGQFDPEVCALVEQEAMTLFSGFNPISNWEIYLDLEPGQPYRLKKNQLATIAAAFADFTDNKSGWFLGHSHQVAALACDGAKKLDLAPEDSAELHLAALLHDTGRCAVPNGIWDKVGPLTPMELRLVHSHSRHTENILTLSTAFAPIADTACSAHERCDGSGYHRRSRLEDGRAALLASANMYQALISERPWREAYSATAAADILLAEVAQGCLPRQSVRAILEVAGHRKSVAEKVYPDGLTKREAEVLALLAQGFTTKVIADKLFIATKTADNHIQKLYEKIGANSRTAAAMYALEQGIFTK